MVEDSFGPQTTSLVLAAEGVDVTYAVHEDREHRTLKGRLASLGQRTPPRQIEAVKHVSFRLSEGDALGLVGLNGSGKSSLLRALAGLIPLTGGRVRARSEPVLLGVGAALHPELSGRRNVFLGGTAMGLAKSQVAERFDDIVTFAGVEEFIDMPLRTFSSGMQARLRFSIAAAVEPDILLIDEALSVGDAEFKQRSDARMRELIRSAGALVLVSHSLSSIEDICKTAIWMHNGVIRRFGPVGDVLDEYRQSVSSG